MSHPDPAPACAFCQLAADQVWLGNEHAVAFRDRYPVTEGHSLIVPRIHHASVFDASPEEQRAL